MNTFHIEPTIGLAFEAYPQVQEILKTQGNLWIAVRGQSDFYGDEDFYTVSPAPDQDDRAGYEWTYVLAQDWVDAYEGSLWVLMDEFGNQPVGRRFPSEEAAKKFRSELDHGAYDYAVLSTFKLRAAS